MLNGKQSHSSIHKSRITHHVIATNTYMPTSTCQWKDHLLKISSMDYNLTYLL